MDGLVKIARSRAAERNAATSVDRWEKDGGAWASRVDRIADRSRFRFTLATSRATRPKNERIRLGSGDNPIGYRLYRPTRALSHLAACRTMILSASRSRVAHHPDQTFPKGASARVAPVFQPRGRPPDTISQCSRSAMHAFHDCPFERAPSLLADSFSSTRGNTCVSLFGNETEGGKGRLNLEKERRVSYSP